MPVSSLGNILLIDDNPKLIKDTLPMYGYHTDCAENGILGLEFLEKNYQNIDLVLLDIMMPKMDGWETLKRIRENKKFNTIPVIMLTAVDEDYKQISGLKIGADDYIVKPFILPNLLARIEALIRRSRWGKDKDNKSFPTKETIENVGKLTQRELEILKMVSAGATNADIAEKLFVKEVTIKTHLNSIYKKLNVENRVQAVLLALETEIINK
jgi:DNA-binding NarL/FixJ family response regulator